MLKSKILKSKMSKSEMSEARGYMAAMRYPKAKPGDERTD